MVARFFASGSTPASITTGRGPSLPTTDNHVKRINIRAMGHYRRIFSSQSMTNATCGREITSVVWTERAGLVAANFPRRVSFKQFFSQPLVLNVRPGPTTAGPQYQHSCEPFPNPPPFPSSPTTHYRPQIPPRTPPTPQPCLSSSKYTWWCST